MSQVSPPVKFSDLLKQSWETIRDDLPLVCGLSLVYWLGVFVLAQFRASLIFEFPLSAGYLVCLLKIGKKQPIRAEDFFFGFCNFRRVFNFCLAAIIRLMALGMAFGFPLIFGVLGVIFIPFLALKILLGLVIILPAIYVSVGTCLLLPVLVATESDCFEAFGQSMSIVTKDWFWFFKLCLFCGLIHFVGLCCFLIGTLIAVPLTLLILYFAYQMKKAPDSITVVVKDAFVSEDSFSPSPAPSNVSSSSQVSVNPSVREDS